MFCCLFCKTLPTHRTIFTLYNYWNYQAIVPSYETYNYFFNKFPNYLFRLKWFLPISFSFSFLLFLMHSINVEKRRKKIVNKKISINGDKINWLKKNLRTFKFIRFQIIQRLVIFCITWPNYFLRYLFHFFFFLSIRM